MGKRKRKEAKHLKTHTYVRAAQRFGICLDEEKQSSIVADIQNGRGEFVERQSRYKTVWKVKFEGKILGVVYDRRFKSLVTIIPQTDSMYLSQNEDKKVEKTCQRKD